MKLETAASDALQRWQGPRGTVLVEVRKTHSARDVRAALIALAYALGDEPAGTEAVCVLMGSRLSPARVTSEVSKFREIVRPKLAGKVHWLLEAAEGQFCGSFEPKDEAFWHLLKRQTSPSTLPPRRSSHPARLAVSSALVVDLLDGGAPLRTLKEWQRISGVSYPTLSNVLADLSRRSLLDTPHGRGARLRPLSTDELLTLAREHAAKRQTQWYADPSRLLTPERLAARVTKLRSGKKLGKEVRIGGVLGAAARFPSLDISAAPRLDLSVGATSIPVDLLDPGLVPLDASQPHEHAVLAVHHTFDALDALGLDDATTSAWASSFECLADLMEMGYVREAEEMGKTLTAKD